MDHIISHPKNQKPPWRSFSKNKIPGTETAEWYFRIQCGGLYPAKVAGVARGEWPKQAEFNATRVSRSVNPVDDPFLY